MSPTGSRRFSRHWHEVFVTFLKLGLTSFGGPVAHIGYFRQEIVIRRRWLDEEHFADLVALCQFLPGPASSQLGFALGLLRGGPIGAFLAWCAFTLPSALLLIAFAYGAASLQGPVEDGLIHGLKLVAVAVVAQAVWSMGRNLVPDIQRALIMIAALLLVIFAGGSLGQIGAIAIGAMAGLFLCRGQTQAIGYLSFAVSRSAAFVSLALFCGFFVGVPLAYAVTHIQGLALFDAFFRSGALVFGGGHVVLPLLKTAVVEPGWVSQNIFLSGYAAAQAVPGPLFTFAAFLGAVSQAGPHGLAGASIALVAIFLPGFLLLVAALPFWDRLRLRPSAQAAMRGANAAVVGILAAALYNPVWTSAVMGPLDVVLAVLGFLALTLWSIQPWVIVLLGGLIGIAIAI